MCSLLIIDFRFDFRLIVILKNTNALKPLWKFYRDMIQVCCFQGNTASVPRAEIVNYSVN